ncbi:hypothetical protein PVAND_010122 [Polypedilum vanderplanki]|uniref:Uncharacterized protein n=1 Tax=Polypedilum vanderplanki TaxID=319348 RepID=A0A9J6CEW5_POLVA|nr:hypothetical protein PVAND_010122 [Polypedilum vanderplanki]
MKTLKHQQLTRHYSNILQKRLVESEMSKLKVLLCDSDVEMKNTDAMDISNEIESRRVIDATLIFADGGDGTTGFSHFHQKNENDEVVNDHSLFTWSTTPISLRTNEGVELWRNPIPNSPFSNRPICWNLPKKQSNMYKKYI